MHAIRLLALTLAATTAPVLTQLWAQQPAGPNTVRPLSLDEALRIAEDASEAVGIARAGVLRARGEQHRARSEFFPQLSGSASYTYTIQSQFEGLSGDGSALPPTGPCSRFNPNPALPIAERVDSLERSLQCVSGEDPFAAFNNLPFGRENQYNLGLSVSQTLFAGGRVIAQTRVANATRRSAEVELASQRAQLVLSVSRAYYDAVLSDRLVSIAEASLEQAETTLRDTRLAREVGKQPEFDLLRAEVTRDNQRPPVIRRRADRDIAYLRLKQLLNVPLQEPVVLTTTLGDTASTTELPPMVEVTSDTSAEARAGVRQAAEEVRAEEGRLSIAKAERLPSLTLSSQYARLGYPSGVLPSSWSSFLTDWNVALTMRVPLFTGGRLKGQRMVAQADLETARLRLAQTREEAAVDTRDAEAQLDAALATWTASAGTVEQARRAYEIAEIRYREGISTQTELSESRLLLQEARANRAQAARDLQIARTRMSLLGDLPLAAR